MRSSPRASLILVVLLALAFLAPAAARAEGFTDEPAYKSLVKQDLKMLEKLLKDAIKEDYRRQAWWIAERILTLDPANGKASDVLDEWTLEELDEGQTPDAKWRKKRDKEFEEMGDNWFRFGEVLEASGMDPLDYRDVTLQALRYGSQAGPLMTAMDQSGYRWCASYLDREVEKVAEILGPEALEEVYFPPTWDDEYVGIRTRWPDATVVQIGKWRLYSDVPWDRGLAHARVIWEVAAWIEDTFRGKYGKDVEHLSVLMFQERDKYTSIGAEFINPDDHEAFRASNRWFDLQGSAGRGGGRRRWRRRRSGGVTGGRGYMCITPAENTWIPETRILTGVVGRMCARHMLSGGAGGLVTGRGAWLLEGFAGAMEGLVRDDQDEWSLDPTACWQLSAARALRDEDKLLPWDELYDLDLAASQDVTHIEVAMKHGGGDRVAKGVNPIHAQATALCVGIIKWHAKKGPKAFANLLADLYKRDSLPDLAKSTKMRSGQPEESADTAMDAAHGD